MKKLFVKLTKLLSRVGNGPDGRDQIFSSSAAPDRTQKFCPVPSQDFIDIKLRCMP
jgi:hypothetical protein